MAVEVIMELFYKCSSNYIEFWYYYRNRSWRNTNNSKHETLVHQWDRIYLKRKVRVMNNEWNCIRCVELLTADRAYLFLSNTDLQIKHIRRVLNTVCYRGHRLIHFLRNRIVECTRPRSLASSLSQTVFIFIPLERKVVNPVATACIG